MTHQPHQSEDPAMKPVAGHNVGGPVLTANQQRILRLMQERPADRDLYETAGDTSWVGNGLYAVTHTPDDKYVYLTVAEVKQMVAAGLLDCRWPGCFKLAGAKRSNPKGNEIPNWDVALIGKREGGNADQA